LIILKFKDTLFTVFAICDQMKESSVSITLQESFNFSSLISF
jgi:hypothetical protein